LPVRLKIGKTQPVAATSQGGLACKRQALHGNPYYPGV
jgi:hypothetical protein